MSQESKRSLSRAEHVATTGDVIHSTGLDALPPRGKNTVHTECNDETFPNAVGREFRLLSTSQNDAYVGIV